MRAHIKIASINHFICCGQEGNVLHFKTCCISSVFFPPQNAIYFIIVFFCSNNSQEFCEPCAKFKYQPRCLRVNQVQVGTSGRLL
jgi:hypothetical protein